MIRIAAAAAAGYFGGPKVAEYAAKKIAESKGYQYAPGQGVQGTYGSLASVGVGLVAYLILGKVL